MEDDDLPNTIDGLVGSGGREVDGVLVIGDNDME